jgi:FkbM family methyltransferase
MIGPFRECFFDEQYMLHFDKKDFPQNPVILDVGANVGFAALYFFRCFPNATVHSFEPMPFLQKMMEQHKAQYSGHNWNQHAFGLWKEDGTMDIYTDAPDDFTSISGIVHFEDAVHKVRIPVRTLSAFLDENNLEKVDLLKMDCEGAEYEILFNLPDSYFNTIGRMAMETHETQQYTTVEMAEFLKTKGYQVRYVTRPATRTGHVWAWK